MYEISDLYYNHLKTIIMIFMFKLNNDKNISIIENIEYLGKIC